MARARNIKPGFFQNEELGELDPVVRLAFIGMWTIADFKGCFEYRPKRLKIQLLPYDDISPDEVVSALEQSRFIRIYSVEGRNYVKINNFLRHQNPHKNERDAGSEIPDFEEKYLKINDLTQDGTKPEKIGTARADSGFRIPDSGSLIPDSLSLIPSGVEPSALRPLAVADAEIRSEKPESALQAVCRETWRQYSDAYFGRYGTEPVRNAKVNAQIKQFCQALAHDEAPLVAAFFIGHNDAFYVKKMHAPGLMLADAGKLRTEWATGNRMTTTRARQMDGAGTMLDAAERIKREMGYA